MSPAHTSVDDDLRWIMDRIRADLPGDQTPPRLLLDPAFSDPERRTSGEDPSDAVVEIGANRKRIGLEHGRETACLSVMSAVQDALIERTGAPWPEVVDDDGQSVGVLDVDVDQEGHAVWVRADEVVGPIGGLVEACAARGWRIC